MILRPDPHARDPAPDLLLRVGGTRFELVTSSVSGRSAGCLGVPLNAPESTSPGRTLPPGAWGCLQDCREWLPPLAPALALWLRRSGTVDARTPPLGHDTTSITATAARSRWPKNPSGVAACQQQEDITP